MTEHILILSSDLSDNSLGRTWILADMLARYNRVEIAGIAKENGIWKPLANNENHKIHAIAAQYFPNLIGTWRLLFYVLFHEADIIYISKPKFPGMVAGLLGKRGRRLVLDNDDWEAGSARAGNWSSSKIFNWLASKGISFTQLADWMIPLCKNRTVSNVHFQKRYGGTVIPHARDAKRFELARTSKREARDEFKLPQNETIIMFFGTPHRHKGVEKLIRAVTLCKNTQISMLVAGLNSDMQEYPSYVAAAERELKGRYHFLPYVDWNKGPKLLAAADVLIVPQTRTVFTEWGQTPAKIFDAMAAGKPLVVSDIADAAQLVRGNAWLVPPDDPIAIARALDEILEDEKAAQQRASKLQERFLALYSYDHIAPVLHLAVTGHTSIEPNKTVKEPVATSQAKHA